MIIQSDQGGRLPAGWRARSGFVAAIATLLTAARGDTLGISVNHGPQKFGLVLRHDGVHALVQPGQTRMIKRMPMDASWHRWRVEMRDGVARIEQDGRFLGTVPVVIDARIGDRPISLHVRTTDRADPVELRIDYFHVRNLPEGRQ